MFQIAEIFIEQIQIKENTDLNITMEGIQHAFILEYYAVYTPSQLCMQVCFACCGLMVPVVIIINLVLTGYKYLLYYAGSCAMTSYRSKVSRTVV